MSFQFEPLQDKIIVKRIDEAETKVNGLFIPESAKEKPQEAEVIAVGPGRVTETGQLITSGLVAGDRILFGKYSGTEIKFKGQEYLILRQDEIFGRIKIDAEPEANGNQTKFNF